MVCFSQSDTGQASRLDPLGYDLGITSSVTPSTAALFLDSNGVSCIMSRKTPKRSVNVTWEVNKSSSSGEMELLLRPFMLVYITATRRGSHKTTTCCLINVRLTEETVDL